MAKPTAWIIIKILDRSKAWNNRNRRWGDLASATKFANQNYLLPQGGMWKVLIPETSYDWSEGDILSSYR